MTNYKIRIILENIAFSMLIILWLLPICVCSFDFAAYILLDRFVLIEWSFFRTISMLIWTVSILIILNNVKE